MIRSARQIRCSHHVRHRVRAWSGVGGAIAKRPLEHPPARQIPVDARTKRILHIGGSRFRDVDGDGRLTPYEGRRLSPAARADDLVRRLALAEKVRELLHGTLPDLDGALRRSDQGYDMAALAPLLRNRHLTSFVMRLALPLARIAEEDNAVQAMAAGEPRSPSIFYIITITYRNCLICEIRGIYIYAPPKSKARPQR